MLLLHCGMVGRAVVLWGERTPTPNTTTPTAKRPAHHPFAASADELTVTLAALNVVAKPTALTLALPSVRGGPAPSSPLLGELPTGKPTLKAWLIPAAETELSAALAFLAGVGDRPALGTGVGVGVTLRYCGQAVRFAATLVAREQFLPDVVQEGKHWFARWVPVIAGADRGRFDLLAKAMPPACRAEARSAADVLRAFLAVAVDALARGGGVKPPRAAESVHDHWLHALASPTGKMGSADADSSQLSAQVREWRAPVTSTQQAAYRLCLRLDEPADDDRLQTWHVRYLLQAHADPSLHLPAADVWAGTARAAATDPKPILLAGLGQAANLSADVGASLKASAPVGFTTSTAGAHRFLNETAWLLEQAGFGVLLPAWWSGLAVKPQVVTAGAKVKSPPMNGGGGMTLEDLVQFEWRVAVGDDEVTLAELQELAKAKEPLVKFRGKWVQVNEADIRAAIELLRKKPAKITAREAMKLALGITPANTPLPVRGATATGWVDGFLKELTAAAFAELPPPAGLRATLRPYQVRGYSWLVFLRQWGLGACLADHMGLGKTLQLLAVLQHAREQGETKPTLLVCPMSVVGNWTREAARFTPDLSVHVHHGPNRAKTAAALKKAAANTAVVLTSYGLLARDQKVLEPMNWSAVVLDEAQTVKNPNTKTAQAARALPADFRVALTGTPVENHVGDLWAISQFLNPGLLGTAAAFRREFFTPIQHHNDAAATARLKKLTAPFLLRRLKTDPTVITDLPAKIEQTAYCTLTREQASLYTAVVNELGENLTDTEGIQRKGMVLGALSKLKQICNHPAQFLGDRSAIPNRSGKLARLTEMMTEVIESGEKALVFTQFTEMGDILQRHLRDAFAREVLFLHGGIPRKQRDAMVARFQSADGPPVFLLSLKAGGTGLNLTAATHVFHFDRWWNPAVEEQATDRAFRIGQTRTVQVHAFVCAGTLEEKIDEMLARKREVAGRVVGTGEAMLTDLSDAQLRDALALRPGAVEDL